MSATVVSLPPATGDETVDFLRRMASMVSGRNGEMLMKAAATIEALGQRAMSAEQLYHRQQEDSTRNAELREVAERASVALLKQIEGLRAQVAETTAKAAQERAELEADKARLLARAEGTEARLAEAGNELEALRQSIDTFNEAMVAVPVEMLRLARAQFNYLSDGFARSGDVILQTMSEIGGFAIEQALTGKSGETPG